MDLDVRRVVVTRREIGLGERVVGERTRDLRAVDLQAEPRGRLRCCEPCAGVAERARDGEIGVVIGEAHGDAVAACDDPAARERGDAGVKLRLEGGRDASHGLISTSGMRGTLPAAKAERSTSR